ncbi:hypothetical protein [Paraburkholderia sp.]|uniref:hypothetical protein n=1 Tax=Paraburkholderia sp. TaxID=1926495 RepID=UPI0039E717D2
MQIPQVDRRNEMAGGAEAGKKSSRYCAGLRYKDYKGRHREYASRNARRTDETRAEQPMGGFMQTLCTRVRN